MFNFARAHLLAAVVALLLACGASEPEAYLQPWAVERPPGTPRASLELRLVVEEAQPGGLILKGPQGELLHLAATPVVTQDDITGTGVGRSSDSPYYVAYVHFTPSAAGRLQEFTRQHLGARLAIVVDGKVLFAPIINMAFGPTGIIQGRFTREQMTDLAQRLAP